MVFDPEVFCVLFLSRHVPVLHLRIHRNKPTEPLLYADFHNVQALRCKRHFNITILFVLLRDTTKGDRSRECPRDCCDGIMGGTFIHIELLFYESFLVVFREFVLERDLALQLVELQ